MKTDIELLKEDTDRTAAIHRWVTMLSTAGLFKSCLNCLDWEEGDSKTPIQKCKRFKMRPPTKIIVNGCELHTDDIPF